jgi:tape measure domain-containing protein
VAVSIGGMSIGLGLNSSGFNAGLAAAAARAEQFSQKIGRAGARLPGGGAGGGRGASVLGGAVAGGVGAVVFSGLELLKSLITGVWEALKGAASALVSFGTDAVSQYAKFEQMRTSFDVMTGSAEEGGRVFGELTEMARATPFTLEGLAKGTQRMMAFGFSADQALDFLEPLGNLAAASPEGMESGIQRITLAIGQMRSKTRVMAQEMNQLTEAGVPSWDALATHMGISTKEAMGRVEARQVSATTMFEALTALGTGPKFGGLMQKQSQTVFGLMSTLKDSYDMLMGYGPESVGGGIVEAFDVRGTISGLGEVITLGARAFASWQPYLAIVGQVFTALRDAAFSAFRQLTEGFGFLSKDNAELLPSITAVKVATLEFAEKAALALQSTGYIAAQTGKALYDYLVVPLRKVTMFTIELFEGVTRWAGETGLAGALGLGEDMGRHANAIGNLRTRLSDLTAEMNRGREAFGNFVNEETSRNARGHIRAFFGDQLAEVRSKAPAVNAAVGGIMHAAFYKPLAPIARRRGKPNFGKDLDMGLAGQLVAATEGPLTDFDEQIGKMKTLLDAGVIGEGERGWNAYALGVMKAVEALEKANGALTGDKSPEALLQGSAAAFSAINRFNQQGARDPQQRILDALIRAQEIEKEQLRVAKEIAEGRNALQIKIVKDIAGFAF